MSDIKKSGQRGGGKVGRPKKSPTPGTRVALGLRVPAELKVRLDAAAAMAGRSQGEEAARRLTASFELQPINEIMTITESTGGGRWFEQPEKADLVFRMVTAYLRSLLSDNCRSVVNFDETFGVDEGADKVIRLILENLERERDNK